MQRREFIKNSIASIAGLGLAPHAFAQLTKSLSAQNEYFLQFIVPNGWDVLLAMDPWTSKRPDQAEMFLDYREDEIGKLGELFYGPAMRPMKAYLSQAAVINGIYVSKTSVDHIALRNYMITGSGSGTKACAAIEYLAHQADSGAWGLLTDDSVPSGPHSIAKSSVANLTHLTSVKGGVKVEDKPTTPVQGVIRDYLKGLALEKNYVATLKSLSAKNPDPELSRGQVVAAAFKAKTSRAAALTINPKSPLNSLDTHTEHEKNHMRSLTDVFRQITAVLDLLHKTEGEKGKSLLSQTNVYITSEFSRSPSLNNSQGKEHNAFTNSAILMGPRIVGGRAIGGTTLIPKAQTKDGESLHIAQYVNPENGKIIKTSADLKQGVLIKPETVVANLLMAAGVRRDQLDPELAAEPTLKTLQKIN